ncbi:BP74-related protein [Streptomyces mirabilis]|uniref:BP74-related protein n=1 Tax=Streptomyces mirabilis TaxID=68239 RepID=UPI003F4CE8F9
MSWPSSSVFTLRPRIEVCDATIPYVEDHLDEAGGPFLQPAPDACTPQSLPRTTPPQPRHAPFSHADRAARSTRASAPALFRCKRSYWMWSTAAARGCTTSPQNRIGQWIESGM